MVVSEMKERLSPNMAPPMTDATQRAREKPEVSDTAVGSRDKARYHKENSNGKTGRDKRQHQISNAFSAASSYDTDKGSGCQEDEKHGDDVLISDALPHQLQFPVKGKRTVLETGRQDRKHKCDNNRNVVKAHRDLHDIF